MQRTCFAILLLSALLPAQPQRIISTSPSITEILYALDLGNQVAGVTEYCHHPPEAKSKPKVGSFIQPNLETIASLRPHLVIIQKNPIQLESKLARLNLETLEVDYGSVDQVFESIARIGQAAGVSNRAELLNRKLRLELDQVRRATASRPRRPMTFIVGRTPGKIEGLIAVGSASYLRDLIQIAGGRNVFEDATGAYPQITLESLVARNPDVILDMGDTMGSPEETKRKREAILALWATFPVLKALRDRQVHPIFENIFVVPGPRVAEAARAFARLLHPGSIP